MKKRSRLVLVLCFIAVFINGQNSSLYDYGVIREKDEVRGYYFFSGEKLSKKESQFTTEIYDQNLALVSKLTFTTEEEFYPALYGYDKGLPQVNKNISLVENTLFIQMYKAIDEKKFFSKIYIFDVKKNVLINSFDVPKEDVYALAYKLHSGNILLGVKSAPEGKKGTELRQIDFNNKTVWSEIVSDETYLRSGFYLPTDIDEKYLFVNLKKFDKKIAFSAAAEDYRIYDKTTGKLQFIINEPIDEKIKYNVFRALYLKNGNFLVYGNYALKTENPLKTKENCENQGLFFTLYDGKGNQLKTKKYTYEEYFKRAICLERKPETRHIGNIYIRKSYIEDNKIGLVMHVDEFAIPAEPNNTLLKTVSDNIFIFELDYDLNLLTWNNLNNSIQEKQELVRNQKYLKVKDPEIIYYKDKQLINVIALVKKNKNIGLEKNKFISLVYKKGDPLKIDEVEINGEADITEFYPAKPGYLMVFEYFEKEKKIDKRLIKLSY
jgi:hypothetical protein